MRIFYGDLLQGKAVYSSGERVGYPATNAQHIHLSRVWRSLSASSQFLTFDAGVGVLFSAAAVAVAIAAHNLSASAVVKAQANDVDDWSTPPVNFSLDPTQEIMIVPIDALSRRFLHLSFDDPANPDGFIQVGRAALFLRWDSTEPIAEGVQLKPEDSSTSIRSPSGQKFTDIGIRTRVYQLSMGTQADETRQALEAISIAVRMDDPVVVIPEDSRKLAPLYCTLEVIPSFTQAGGWAWTDGGLTFKEAF